MNILGIDTATRVCSVAVTRDGAVLGEVNIDAGTTHSQKLLLAMEQALRQAGLGKEEIDLVGVSMGPGSFTGLRIGLATAEAFAYARKQPLHGVNTLMALACNCREEGRLLSPIIDAQKGNYYQALYRWQAGELCCLAPTEIVNVEKLLERIQGRECLLLGECGKLKDLPGNIEVAEDEIRMPLARSICYLSQRDYNREQDQRIFGLEPYYIRRSEAEELWERLHP